MNKQTIATANRIKQFCDEFLQKKMSFSVFQTTLEAVYSNFENDIPKELQNFIGDFMGRLESIEWMSEEENHFKLIAKEIEKLITFLSRYEQK